MESKTKESRIAILGKVTKIRNLISAYEADFVRLYGRPKEDFHYYAKFKMADTPTTIVLNFDFDLQLFDECCEAICETLIEDNKQNAEKDILVKKSNWNRLIDFFIRKGKSNDE